MKAVHVKQNKSACMSFCSASDNKSRRVVLEATHIQAMPGETEIHLPASLHFALFGNCPAKVFVSIAPEEIGISGLAAQFQKQVHLRLDPPSHPISNSPEDCIVIVGKQFGRSLHDIFFEACTRM